MNLFHTPVSINESIEKFAQTLSKEKPIFIKNISTKEQTKADCFENVKTKVQESGGKAIFGWIIWEIKGIILQAEFHSIWERDDEFFDITPYDRKVENILFVPTPNKNYEQQRVNNIYYKIEDKPEIDMYIDSRNLLFNLVEEYKKGIKNEQMSKHLNNIKNRQNRFLTFIKNKIGRNGHCFCKSGKKLKNCCMNKEYE
jgi:hypothetical protein